MKLLGCVLGLLLSTSAFSQTPPPAQTPRRPRPKPVAMQVTVRDPSGAPIAYAHISVTGPISRTVLTNADGGATLPAMPDGTFRFRFERDGFVTLEREVVIHNGQPQEFEAQMSPAAAPPPPPAPEPAAAPTNAPAPAPAPSGPPVTVSIPEFLDKNFIGARDPLKESVLGCTAASTTRLLQLRDPIATHTHDLDEIVYVVAGDGAVRMRSGASGDEATVVHAGSLTVIPRGVPHAIERRGRNPLIVLSTLAGAPCQSPTTTHQDAKR